MKIKLKSTRGQCGLYTNTVYKVMKETETAFEFIDDDFDYRFILKAEFKWVVV